MTGGSLLVAVLLAVCMRALPAAATVYGVENTDCSIVGIDTTNWGDAGGVQITLTTSVKLTALGVEFHPTSVATSYNLLLYALSDYGMVARTGVHPPSMSTGRRTMPLSEPVDVPAGEYLIAVQGDSSHVRVCAEAAGSPSTIWQGAAGVIEGPNNELDPEAYQPSQENVRVALFVVGSELLEATSGAVTTGPAVSPATSGAVTTGASVPPTCVTACGDPHFTGLDGVKYNFRGAPDRTFALISDATVQLNSMFRRGPSHHTYLGETCLRVCNATLRIDPAPAHVGLNGHGVLIGERVSAGSLTVHRAHKHSLEVEVAGRWSITFRLGEHLDVLHVVPHYSWDNKTHGVIGHTLAGRGRVDNTKKAAQCNKKSEGACEIEGDYRDYIVHGSDLCSAEWKHPMVDERACA